MIEMGCELFRFVSGCWQLDEEDFKEEQNLVARLVHMLVNDDNEQMFQVREQSLTKQMIRFVGMVLGRRCGCCECSDC